MSSSVKGVRVGLRAAAAPHRSHPRLVFKGQRTRSKGRPRKRGKGKTRQDKPRQHHIIRHKITNDNTRQNQIIICCTRKDERRQNQARRAKTRQGKARQDKRGAITHNSLSKQSPATTTICTNNSNTNLQQSQQQQQQQHKQRQQQPACHKQLPSNHAPRDLYNPFIPRSDLVVELLLSLFKGCFPIMIYDITKPIMIQS